MPTRPTPSPTGASRISLTHAVAILESAMEAGLVAPDASFAPALRAKLADLGVGGLRRLNTDQAEEVEAFVAGVRAARRAAP